MIDAYTIGITLALEDGVSEGVVAIRHDLAALDAAIADSAARLMMLRKLAADMALQVPQMQVVQGASPSLRPASDRQAAQATAILTDTVSASSSTTPSEAPAATPPVPQAVPAPKEVSASRPPVPPSVAIPAPLVGRPFVAPVPDQLAPPGPASPDSQPPHQNSPAVAPAIVQHVVPLSATAPTSVVQPVLAAPVVPPAPAAPPASTVVHLVQPTETQRDLSTTVDFGAIARALAPSVSVPADPRPHALEQRPAVEMFPGVAPQGNEALVPQESLQRAVPPPSNVWPPPVSTPPEISRRSEVPKPLPQQRNSAGPVVSFQMPRIASRAPPNTPKQSLQTTDSGNSQDTDRSAYAELHLDGAALGRWVTRHLERQVLRPQAGATGFDPRITPSWSGAPIGN